MLNSQKKVKIEWLNEVNEGIKKSNMTNPLEVKPQKSDKIALMVKKILQEEIPQLKDNSLLYDLVLYTIIEKMNTVQTVGNVLSYIRKNHVKEVQDVSIENGEIRIKCSV